jgi:hypothetical protein
MKIESPAPGLCCLPKRHNAFLSTPAIYSGQQWVCAGMTIGAGALHATPLQKVPPWIPACAKMTKGKGDSAMNSGAIVLSQHGDDILLIAVCVIYTLILMNLIYEIVL